MEIENIESENNFNLKKEVLEDKYIDCIDCDVHFRWTAGEQGFYISHGYCDPKRCPRCRLIRREEVKARELREAGRQ